MNYWKPLERKTLIGLFLGLVIVAAIFNYLYIHRFNNKQLPSIIKIDHWQYSWSNSSSYNSNEIDIDSGDYEWRDFTSYGKLPNEMGLRNIWIRFMLPEGEWNEPCLLFRSIQQDVRVYIEDKPVYQYGSMDFDNKKNAPGSTWNFVTIPENYQGKTVIINLYTPFIEFAGFIDELQIGSKSDLILETIYKYIGNIVLGSIFIFIGISLSLIYFSSRRKEIQYISIGLSSVFIGIWVVAESKVIQLFINEPIGWMYTAYVAIFLMPIGFCVFIERSFGTRNQVIFKRLIQTFICLIPLAFALELTHTISIFRFVRLYHMVLVLAMFFSIITLVRSANSGNKEAAIFTIGLIIACLSGIHDIISIFYPKLWFGSQRLSQWGILVLTLTVVYILGKRLKSYHETLQMNYQSLFQNMIDAFIYCKVIVNEDNQPKDFLILEINQAFEELFILNRSIIGKRINEICPNINDNKDWIDIFGKIALLGETKEFNSVRILEKWCNISAFTPMPGFICVILKDITEKKKAEEVIKFQAFHDSVTGVYNRMYFEKEIIRINKELPSLKPLSIISIDLDGLKIINDTLGHSIGDSMLKEAARIIFASLGSSDFVARIGGDEFCVILENGDSLTAKARIDKINQLVKTHNDREPIVPLSMSLGFASYDSNLDKDIFNVYKRADDNMYQYKLGQASSMKSRVVEMLMTAISKRDYVSEGHVERLVTMAEKMADKLKISDTEKRNLILLAKMHDLGKIGIPDEILFKNSRLTEEEYKKMKEHSKIGYSIANRTYELSHIASLILHHHEYWNGKGYPDGIKGEDIPLECRIISIIDAYDAMTSRRPYNEGVSMNEALKELRQCAGTQFDPVLVDAFIEIIQS